MLARDLIREAPGGHDIVGRDIDDFDITDPDAVDDAVREIRPDLIVNAAAYTNVDGAESESDVAFAVNGDALGFIGNAAKALSVAVIHYSTDYVFDGSSREPYGEDESTSPMGVYGASKLQGEQRLAESGAASLIIRTQWLFGIAGPSFPRTMLKRATSGEATRVVDDQTGRPTYTVDLGRAAWGRLVVLVFVRLGGRGPAGQPGASQARGIGSYTYQDARTRAARSTGSSRKGM